MSARSRHRFDGTWSLSGLLRPDEVLEQTGISLPEDDDYETIAGLINQYLGRLAQRGDVVRLTLPLPPEIEADDDERDIVSLAVERMDGRRVDRVTLTVESGPDAAASMGGARP